MAPIKGHVANTTTLHEEVSVPKKLISLNLCYRNNRFINPCQLDQSSSRKTLDSSSPHGGLNPRRPDSIAPTDRFKGVYITVPTAQTLFLLGASFTKLSQVNSLLKRNLQ